MTIDELYAPYVKGQILTEEQAKKFFEDFQKIDDENFWKAYNLMNEYFFPDPGISFSENPNMKDSFMSFIDTESFRKKVHKLIKDRPR